MAGRRPAGARERASRPCGRRARLGRDAPARDRPEPHRRRRLPALVAGDGRPDRLGDAAHRVDRVASGAAASRAGWPRASASRSLRRRRRCRSSSSRSVAWRSCRRSSTSSSCRWSPRRWRRASLALAGGAARRRRCAAGRSGPSLAAPGWVILRILVAVVEAAARPAVRERHARAAVRHRRGGCRVGRSRGASTWWRRRRRVDPSTERAAGPPVRGRRRNPPPNAAHGAGRRASRAAVAGLIVAVAVAGGVVAARPAASPRVSILDVGQGDAILVEGSRGGRLLIDGGPDPDRLLVALDRRIPPWDRRIDAVILSPPARGSCRRSGLAARALPRRPRLRAGDARPRARATRRGCESWPHRRAPIRLAHRRRRPPRRRRDRPARPVADPRSGAGDAARWRDRHQQRVGRPPRPGRDPPVPADGRRRGGHRPVAPRRGPAARRPPQGRPPRQPDRDDAGVRRCRATQASPSRRPGPGTRTGTRRRPRSIGSPHQAPACSGPIGTARSSSGSRPVG